MSDAMPRCAVCGREQRSDEEWDLFVERMNDDRHPICSTECLLIWAGGEAQDPPGLFE
jgi:hypothetical protein